MSGPGPGDSDGKADSGTRLAWQGRRSFAGGATQNSEVPILRRLIILVPEAMAADARHPGRGVTSASDGDRLGT